MTKLARGTTRHPKLDAPPKRQDMNLTIKQLIAPPEHVPVIKDLTVTNIDKPDVHLRSDLMKPMEMMRIHSAQRVMKAQNSPESSALHLDDESVHSETYNFEEMVRVGRPERDLSLHKPLMRKLQTLRRYKMGTSPNLKAGLLRETLEPIAKDSNTKRMLSHLSTRGRPSSPLASIVCNESMSLEDVFGQTGGMMATSASSPTFRATSALDTDREKDVVVREGGDVNMNLYHLSSQGKRTLRTAQSSRGNSRMGRANSATDLVTDSIDSSHLSSPVDGGEEEEPQHPAMYDPSTVRLPRMEIVPGYGSTTPAIESRLGAYRVHSSQAVTAAAALEEASVFENASRAVSMSSQHGGKGDDSYMTDRVESFYRSAATSQRHSLEVRKREAGEEGKSEAAAEGEQSRKDGDSCQGSRSVTTNASSSIQISAQGVHLATNPPAPSSWQQQGPKQRLHCGKCFKAAQMWCQQCTAAFCGVCWGQVPHHDLTQMSSSPPRPLTSMSLSSPVKHTYAKSVLFQSYESNTKPSLENNRFNQTSAAMIPLPEYVVTQYDEYPAPPVYIDGKGHVVEDLIRKRPVTAPVTTQEELHRLQMSNHFKKQSQQEQYNQLLALKYRAATTGAPNGTSSGAGFPEKAYPNLGVSNGITYKQREPRPLTHSKGDVVVRKNKSKNARLRPSSPCLVANPDGTLSPGYSAKPRTGSKPLTGILRDGTPGDWKTQLFAGNDMQESGRGLRRSGRGAGGGKATTPFAHVKPL